MALSSWLVLGGAVICLVFVALASAVHTAVAYVSRYRFRATSEQHEPATRSVERLLERSQLYESTMAVLRTAATTALLGVVAVVFARERLPGGPLAGLVVAGLLLLVFGHGLPQSLARRGPDRTAARLATFAWIASLLLWPVTALYDAILRFLLRALGRSHPEIISPPTEEEFAILIGAEHGENYEEVIEEDEREMIDAILRLENRTVRDIMVPRVDIVAVPLTASLAEVVQTIQRVGHSRLPVYSGSIDSINGLLYAKDLLRFITVSPTANEGALVGWSLGALLRPVHIVPESKRLDDLLHEMQHRQVHMALVVDEYGGTAGLVTIEDILEEIVGEIHDEHDVRTAPLLEEVNEHEVIADGSVSVEEVSDLLRLGWDDEEHGTLGGLVQRELGHLPAVGEQLEYAGARITVLTVDRHRLKRLRVEKLTSGSPANGARVETEPVATDQAR